MMARAARPTTALQKIALSTGFTLIELLFVLAILAVLSVLALPAIQSVTQSYGITNAVSQVRDTLSGAQQLAVSDNLPVQVRICQPSSGTTYSWLQVCEVENDGTTRLVARATALPAAVCISSNATFSSIMNLTVTTPAATDPPLATMGQAFTYIKITFLPSGATNLSPTSNWFLTLVAVSKGAAATLPSNYASIQIDPVNGITTVYRP